MDSFSEQFKNAFNNHKSTLKDLDNLMDSLDIESTVNENIKLKSETKILHMELEDQKNLNGELNSEITNLKRMYRDQIISEKLNNLGHSKKRMNLLFEKSSKTQLNRLEETENNIRNRFIKFNEKLKKEEQVIKSKYSEKLDILLEKFNSDLKELKILRDLESEKTRTEYGADYNEDDLINVSDEVIEESYKVNNVELKLGLNVLNKLGVILVLFAIILAGRYSFSNWFTDYMKGMVSFTIGIVLLVFGEVIYRKKMKVFSQGLIGGGIGVLYASTFISYFNLGIMSFQMSLFISLVISLAALLLTLRYKSSIICSMAFLGGYLPFFTYAFVFGLDKLPINGALAYLTMFNILILLISMRYKWYPVIYLSFFFNILCSNFLIGIMDNYWVGIVYSYLLFTIYLAVIIMRNIRHKEPLGLLDMVLLILNSIINVSMVYYLFNKGGFGEFDGLLAVVYALVYYMFARITEKRLGDIKMINTFYIFAIAFAILMIPLQLTKEWLFFGWVIESLVFIYYGKQSENKAFKYLGNILFGISHFVFLFLAVENLFEINIYPGIFDLKYLSLLISEVAVIWIYKEKHDQSSQGELSKIYRYFVVIHGSIYLIYNTNMTYLKIFGESFKFIYYSVVLTSVAVIIYNIIIEYIGIKEFIEFENYKKITNTLAYMYLIILNTLRLPASGGIEYVVGVVILIMANLLILIKANGLFKELEKNGTMNREVRAVILASYLFCIYFMNLVVKFQPQNWSITVNISMILFAMLYIFIGFKDRFTRLRRIGLILSLIATAKMTMFDLGSTSMIQKIVGFFVFGFILIAISFVYQKLSEKLTQDEV